MVRGRTQAYQGNRDWQRGCDQDYRRSWFRGKVEMGKRLGSWKELWVRRQG